MWARSFRCAPPCYFVVAIVAFAGSFVGPSVAATEVHEEYEAVHQQALWRSPRPVAAASAALRKHVQVEVSVDAQEYHELANGTLSTQLYDMRSEYTGDVGVGTLADGQTPQFHARVVFDTGSTNLWVASALCVTSPCTAEKSTSYYNPEKSLTQESYNPRRTSDIDILFGTGELRGPLHVDTFRVGPMTVKQQPFAMIRKMNGAVFSSFRFEGIVGLAFRSLSFAGIEPFIDRVIKQKVLDHNEFAFYLNADPTKPSALLWGGVDKSLYEGPIRMFPVVQEHYWALELVDVKLGSESMLDGMNPRIQRLIVDSGTTYFTAPHHLYTKLLPRIPAKACADVKDYPPLTYVIKGTDGQNHELVVTQETYMIGSHRTGCHPALMKLDVNKKYGPAMILGEVFMRHFFTVFSRGSNAEESGAAKVGFATAKLGRMPPNVNGAAVLEPSFLQTEGRAFGPQPPPEPMDGYRMAEPLPPTAQPMHEIAIGASGQLQRHPTSSSSSSAPRDRAIMRRQPSAQKRKPV